MAMAGRDTSTALQAYSALAKMHPKSAPLLVDLGRVYEATEAVPKAVAHYLQATQLDDQNPAPFLRMGILYGRSGDPAAAEAAFKRAEELYSARSRVEGVATVSLRARRDARSLRTLSRLPSPRCSARCSWPPPSTVRTCARRCSSS